MKKRFIVLVLLGAMMTAPANAQWNTWHTTQAISGGFGLLGLIRNSASLFFSRHCLHQQKCSN